MTPRASPCRLVAAVLDRDDPDVEDQRQLGTELERRGVEVRWATVQQLVRERIVVDRTSLVAGQLPFVAAGLRQLGIAVPPADDYPEILSDHMHRRVWTSTAGELRGHLDLTGGPVFAKPRVDRKRFTGRIFRSSADWPLPNLPSRVRLWCAEPVEFLSEHRVFVANGKVAGVRCYDGDINLGLDAGVVRRCVEAVGDRLAGYALDLGVLADDRTALVELNDGFSIGAYGLQSDRFADVLIARWRQLLTGY